MFLIYIEEHQDELENLIGVAVPGPRSLFDIIPEPADDLSKGECDQVQADQFLDFFQMVEPDRVVGLSDQRHYEEVPEERDDLFEVVPKIDQSEQAV